ncbi:MAG TPA: glycosyltransferase, partial [Polyangia bacterium]|nr:glycosyltransferase [Polyangia bacterium]
MPTPSAPAVSIVLPTFNRADVIGRALESVRAQSFEDWELLVVDDGSTDGTA